VGYHSTQRAFFFAVIDFANATNLDRKSGVAERRDLRFALVEKRNPELASPYSLGPILEDLFRQVVLHVSLVPHHFVVGGSQ
jgi:hypothetical protein